MDPDYRRALLAILSRLDQISTDADALLTTPGDTEILPMAEELRELIVEMQARVEAKFDAAE